MNEATGRETALNTAILWPHKQSQVSPWACIMVGGNTFTSLALARLPGKSSMWLADN